MEKNIPQLQNLESAKKMILMHEEIFKGQVRELHQLYNLQKKLMCEHENRMKPLKRINHHEQAVQNVAAETGHESCSGDCSRMIIRFDIESSCRSTPSCSVHKLEEKRVVTDADDEEENDVEVELTLNTGHYTRKQRSKRHSHCDYKANRASDAVPSLANRGNEYHEEGFLLSSSSGYQENTRRWMMHDLSLERR